MGQADPNFIVLVLSIGQVADHMVWIAVSTYGTMMEVRRQLYHVSVELGTANPVPNIEQIASGC